MYWSLPLNTSSNIWPDWVHSIYFNSLSVTNITATNAHNVCICCRKKKWRNKGSCTSSPDFIIVVLQKWSCKWSVPAKVVWLPSFSQHLLPSNLPALWLSLPLLTLWLQFFHTGETGPMVTTTLKLGISILNGGNSEVQRVCVLNQNLYMVTFSSNTFNGLYSHPSTENAGVFEG